MSLKAVSVAPRLIRAALLPLAVVAAAQQRPAQAQLVWSAVDPSVPQLGAWGTPVVEKPQPSPAASWPASAAAPDPRSSAPQPSSRQAYPLSAVASQPTAQPYAPPVARPAARPAAAIAAVPLSAPVALPPPAAAPTPEEIKRLREKLRIQPIVKRPKPWPAPSLSPGVPSAFVAQWGDAFLGVSGATAGKQRDGVVDGSWNAGFGLGDAAKAVALEVSGGCGSVKDFCANGSFTARLGRLLINDRDSRLSLAGAWQNFAQWGNEGRQDNVYYGALSYAVPLRPGHSFARTLQFNAGVGNSQYAPVSDNAESSVGAFASVGVELTKYLGLSAGWSGRGANAQLSLTPFRQVPITINLLGADLFNQTPAGTVGVLSISWGANFLTPSF